MCSSDLVSFDPDAYGGWRIEPFKDGIVLFTRSQSGGSQLSLTCGRGGAELLVTRKGLTPKYVADVAQSYGSMESFSFFDRVVPRQTTKFAKTADGFVLRIPLVKADLDTMQAYRKPQGGLEEGPNEPHANMGVFFASFPIDGLERHVRLLRRNCAS